MTIEIARPPDLASITPFWPQNRQRLVLDFVPVGDNVIAKGFDPDWSTEVAVFTANLLQEQGDAFVSAVKKGIAGRLIAPPPSNDNWPVDARTVVVVDPGGGTVEKGPRTWDPVCYYEVDLAS